MRIGGLVIDRIVHVDGGLLISAAFETAFMRQLLYIRSLLASRHHLQARIHIQKDKEEKKRKKQGDRRYATPIQLHTYIARSHRRRRRQDHDTVVGSRRGLKRVDDMVSTIGATSTGRTASVALVEKDLGCNSEPLRDEWG